jgi:tetratricopeptide (TPR) repeat protein
MQSIEKKPTTNPAAYDLYLKGLYASRKPTRESQEESIRYFELATKKDPAFSLAYSAWGNAYVIMGGTWVPFPEVIPRAKELVTKGLELDPKSSEAHMAMGNFALQCEHDWMKAETELKKALSLNPGNFDAHMWYGFLLMLLQRFDEAVDEFREAIRLSPRYAFAWNYLTLVQALSGDLYSAVTLAEEVRDHDPTSFMNHLVAGHMYAAAMRTADALKEAEALAGPPDLGSRVGRAILFGILGKPDEAGRLVKELEERKKTTHVPALWVAALYVILGEKGKAMDLLERDFREGDKNLWTQYLFPPFVDLRNEPRFIALLRAYKLPSEMERPAMFPHAIAGTKQPLGAPT